MKTVGEFTYDEQTQTVAGPALYMEEQGNERLDRIMSGDDVVFNMGCTRSPDVITAVLVALQTNYAGWKGTRDLLASIGGGQ